MLDNFKPANANWRHYFGGLSFIMLILQLLSGLFLIFFFEPTLADVYKSVQRISNEIYGGAFIRNLHRWIPALFFIAVLVHTVRCFLRMDFMKRQKRVLWLTGVLMILPIFLLIVSGLIIPWEWKGYWFMEMFANYLGSTPGLGPDLKAFTIMTYTIPRYLVLHIVVFPIITFVLVDYHMLVRLRRRGIFRYLLKHTIVALPFLILLFYLSATIQIPSADPQELPLPLEGRNIIAPEWYPLVMMLPFMYLRDSAWIPFIAIIAPLVILFAVAFMPYYLSSKKNELDEIDDNGVPLATAKKGGNSIAKKIVTGAIVTVITFVFAGLLYLGSYKSPTLGCNACHNLSRGMRMGVPPETFKDRVKNPILSDNEWMMRHWYFPDEVW